jgi:hypothetical protein
MAPRNSDVHIRTMQPVETLELIIAAMTFLTRWVKFRFPQNLIEQYARQE